MEATVGGIWWDPSVSKPGDREGRREEPGEMETEVPGVTRDREKIGAITRRREDCTSIFSKDYEEGKSEGADLQLENIPKLGEK